MWVASPPRTLSKSFPLAVIASRRKVISGVLPNGQASLIIWLSCPSLRGDPAIGQRMARPQTDLERKTQNRDRCTCKMLSHQNMLDRDLRRGVSHWPWVYVKFTVSIPRAATVNNPRRIYRAEHLVPGCLGRGGRLVDTRTPEHICLVSYEPEVRQCESRSWSGLAPVGRFCLVCSPSSERFFFWLPRPPALICPHQPGPL